MFKQLPLWFLSFYRTCVLPIQLNLYNCAATDLDVLIETAEEETNPDV